MKKTIISIFFILLIPSIIFAANLLDRDEDTAPTSDDMMYCVDDPGGTPTDKKCTVGNVAKGMTSTNLIDTADILYEDELNSVAELETQVSGDFIQQGELLDQDAMDDDSATKPASQQSIKAYVDAQTVTSLTDLSDVNSATDTSGNILVADGSGFESVSISGDVTIDATGAVTIQTGAVGTDEIATDGVDSDEIATDAVGIDEISFIGSSTATVGRILASDGTDFESVVVSGDVTLDSTGKATVNLEYASGSTYKTLDDYWDIFQGNALISGGVVSFDGNTKVDVTGGTAIAKKTDASLEETTFFDFPSTQDLSVTADMNNYIYADYNGGTPQVVITTAATNFWDLDRAFLAQVWYESDNGGTQHIQQLTSQITDYPTKNIRKQFELAGTGVEHVSGQAIGSSGLKVTLTAGVAYSGMHRETTPAFNTGTTDTFKYWEETGGVWGGTSGETDINNTEYNDGTDTQTLANTTKYGTRWVYLDNSSDNMQIILGLESGSLQDALDAQPPSDVPDFITGFCYLVGKIIVKKSAASVSTFSPFTTKFSGSLVQNHDDLGNIQGGTSEEYYHFTATEHTTLEAFAANAALTGLNDVSSATATGGRILVADGTDFESVAISGDITMDSTGVTRSTKALNIPIIKPNDITNKDSVLVWRNILRTFDITRIHAASTEDDSEAELFVVGGDTDGSINWDDFITIEPLYMNEDNIGGVNWYTTNVTTNINWSEIYLEDTIGINWTSGTPNEAKFLLEMK